MRFSIATDRRQLTDIQRRQCARAKEYLLSISAQCFEGIKGYQPLRRGPLVSLVILVSSFFSLLLYITVVRRTQREPAIEGQPAPLFLSFPRVNTYYDGLRSVTSPPCPEGRKCTQAKARPFKGTNREPYPKPFKYNPYLSGRLGEQQDTVQPCALTEGDQQPLPEVWAYATNSYKGPEPMFGSYIDVGLRSDVCFDRYGRYGGYGLGYAQSSGGTGLGMHGDQHGIEEILPQQQLRDWSMVDLGAAQRRCSQLNSHRFTSVANTRTSRRSGGTTRFPNAEPRDGEARGHVSRKAVILRTYEYFDYTEYAKLYIRSLVSELNLASGGEYDIHLLVEVKNLTAPIWASPEVYQEVLERSVPAEFRSMATLWTEKQMELVYPGPFQPQSCCYGPIHWVVRSMHFALQWFASHHPEYEYFWNWEMDIRYVGHWYEFFDRVGEWAKLQPRENLWERSGRFYIPALHQTWANFSRVTAELSRGNTSDSDMHRGSVDASAGVGEDADFLTLDPFFDPEGTDWLYRNDVSGYPTDTEPRPNRRASIVTASRLSRQLLQTMHNETYQNKHTMASEMFSATMALHHNLKAVYVPHPVFFDRAWPPEHADSIFNGGPNGQTGGYEKTVFGGEQYHFEGSSYYYNSGFSSALWRRWLGYRENGEGGSTEELKQGSGGRMCLRSTLLHPIKHEKEKG